MVLLNVASQLTYQNNFDKIYQNEIPVTELVAKLNQNDIFKDNEGNTNSTAFYNIKEMAEGSV